MNAILSTLAASYPASSQTSWISINAEELPDVSEEYDVSAVPYLVLVRDGRVLETVSGSDAIKVRSAIEKHAKSGGATTRGDEPLKELERAKVKDVKPATAIPEANTSATNTAATNEPAAPTTSNGATAPATSAQTQEDTTPTDPEDLHTRLTGLVKAASVMLFMKGTPSAPQCGFSRQLVALLRENSVRYGFFNILADDEVRQGLKEFGDWPTFPQLWVEGELVGGLDIVSFDLLAVKLWKWSINFLS